MNEEIERMDHQLQDMQEVVDDCNTIVTECEEDVQELEEKHDQDIQETKQYAKNYTDTNITTVNNRITDDRIRFAYDDIEENLRMFRNNN